MRILSVRNRTESSGRYYRISKGETTSRLILEMSETLLGEYVRITSPVLEAMTDVEGPEGYLLPDGQTWRLIADHFEEAAGYRPMVSQMVNIACLW